jgi:hypothetical protein
MRMRIAAQHGVRPRGRTVVGGLTRDHWMHNADGSQSTQRHIAHPIFRQPLLPRDSRGRGRGVTEPIFTAERTSINRYRL